MNIAKRIHKANRDRDVQRLTLKYKAMRAGRFAFFRGTCHLFYDRLIEHGFETDSPLAWGCGDLHLENFGSYKADNRLVYFDLNDFDEAALAPATWELVRLLTSVHIGLEEQGMPHAEVLLLVERLIGSYSAALVAGKAAWVERDAARGVVRELLDKLRERKRADFLAARTRLSRRRRRLLVDGVRMLPIAIEERALVNGFMEEFASTQPNPDFYRVLDVARRIAGTGSLGVARYAILVEGHGSPDGNCLFDLKQSGPSSLGHHFARLQPRWTSEAVRITALQSRMQAMTAAFLHPVMLGDRPFVLRALQPTEDRLPFGRLREHAGMPECAMDVMARCLAWAQLRSAGRQGSANADALIAFAGKNKWRRVVAQAAAAMTHQVTLDWEGYCIAFDAGQFEVARSQGGAS
jgi:uncharacterized protein (DUF2252 family)